MDSLHVAAADGCELHVQRSGAGRPVVMLSGGPGCVQYLADDALVPPGMACWFPEPRGVGRSAGGPHTMATAVSDLEDVRRAAGVSAWTVVGHSWGSDLAVRYALDHPGSLSAVVGVAGCGVQQDSTWKAAYRAGKEQEAAVEVAHDRDVHQALMASYTAWIHEPGLLRRLADCPVPMTFLAAGQDIRPSWPLQQLAALVPHGAFGVVAGVPHDLWATHPAVWREVVGTAVNGSDPSSRGPV